MEYDVLKGGHVLLPIISLSNDDGVTIFVSVDQDKAWRRKPRPKGRYVSSVLVPGNFLSEGMLFVNVHLITMFPEVKQFSEYSSAAFPGKGHARRGFGKGRLLEEHGRDHQAAPGMEHPVHAGSRGGMMNVLTGPRPPSPGADGGWK
jgi:hypothetical protein